MSKRVCHIFECDTPSLELFSKIYPKTNMCASSSPSLVLLLAVIEGKLLADDVYVLWVNDAWCHQFEGIRLLAVEGENLEDLGALLARVIAS